MSLPSSSLSSVGSLCWQADTSPDPGCTRGVQVGQSSSQHRAGQGWPPGVSCRLGRVGTGQGQALSRELLRIVECPSGNQECPSRSWVQDLGGGLQHTPVQAQTCCETLQGRWPVTVLWDKVPVLCPHQPAWTLPVGAPCSTVGFTPGRCTPPAKGPPRDDPLKSWL